MKLNFWQILGLLLVIGGAAFYLYERYGKSPAEPKAATSQSISNH